MKAIVVFLGVLAAQFPLAAWGRDGHIVIARMGAAHLTPQARAQVIALLRNDPEAGKYLEGNSPDVAGAMAAVSNWADETKGENGTSAWHFLNLAASQGKTDIPGVCVSDDCITARLAQLIAVLPAGQPYRFGSESFTPAEQLKFVIHFMADLHQPLHCATNADAGGNCIRTSGFSSSELHAAWDTQLVERLEKGGTEKTARSLDAQFASSYAAFTMLTGVEDMAIESHGIAFSGVYPPLEAAGLTIQPVWHAVSTRCGEAPSYEQPPAAVLSWGTFNLAVLYAGGAQEQIVARQLTAAAYRLADLLNRLFP